MIHAVDLLQLLQHEGWLTKLKIQQQPQEQALLKHRTLQHCK